MQLSKDLRQRLSKECHYAVTKMQQSPEPNKKLYYFSVFYGEAQRILNWEWSRDLALIHMVTERTHTQINTAIKEPRLMQLLPIDWEITYQKLTEAASNLATYFEKTVNDEPEELLQILGQLAEIGYAVSGNGSYLYEKGSFKL